MMRGGMPFGTGGSSFHWTNDNPAQGNTYRTDQKMTSSKAISRNVIPTASSSTVTSGAALAAWT